jgi:hypothetical protein
MSLFGTKYTAYNSTAIQVVEFVRFVALICDRQKTIYGHGVASMAPST